MTKRQAKTIITGIMTIILTQALCTAIVLRAQERTRKEAEAAQVSAMDTLEMQKRVRTAAEPDAAALLRTRLELDQATDELKEAQEMLVEARLQQERDGAELEKAHLQLQAQKFAAQERDAANINKELEIQKAQQSGTHLIPLAK